MKKALALFAALVFCAVSPTVCALYSVADEGTWPKTWPAELEPLRKQARTLVGPMVQQSHYEIPFTKRDQFEAAWPYFLKVKSKGAPIILVRAPKTDFMEIKPAGVLIHSPPQNTDKRTNPEVPIPGLAGLERWMNTTYIELIVDGNIVDLNRIPLPADTPIIDKRFQANHGTPPKPSSK
jgi:hypothetical protein